MNKIQEEKQKSTVGGFYWKCQHTYHSSWKNNTFVSAKHWVWATANSRRAEHVRTYAHANDRNTWVTAYP